MNFTLAPSVLVRAPAWPLDCLRPFGDPELARLAPSSSSFERAHREILERERGALWEQTAGDARFMKALLVASPALFERVGHLSGPRAERTKRVRHVETSLYRFLARAAARTTPSGLWSGVALASFGETERVVFQREKVDLQPDLTPVAAALHSLSARREYRDAARFRLNPTLERRATGFHFLAREFGGAIDERVLAANPGVDAWLACLARSGEGTQAELAERADIPVALVEQLVSGGLLVGGLALPSCFSSGWDALEQTADALLATERNILLEASLDLRRAAEEMGTRFEDLSAAELSTRLAEVRSRTVRLFTDLGVSVEVPRVPFRFDSRLPVSIVLSTEMHAELLATLSAYQRAWLDEASPASSLRRERRKRLLESISAGPTRLGERLRLKESAVPSPSALEGLLRSADASITLHEGGGSDEASFSPFGCLFARLGVSSVHSAIGVDDNPIRALARFSELMGKDNAIEVWARREFARLAKDTGLEVAELACPFERNPNALARPELGAVRLAPWGFAGPSLHDSILRERAGAPVLRVPGVGDAVVFSLSSAAVLEQDPVAEWLAHAGFDEPAFHASHVQAEAEDVRFSPRLVLSTGACVRARRTTLTSEFLRSFSRSSRPARDAAFRTLAARLSWPERVLISVGGGTPLHVATSSPLAIESAFEGVLHAHTVTVEEAPTSAWLLTSRGRHLAEVCVPFSRKRHAYSKWRREP